MKADYEIQHYASTSSLGDGFCEVVTIDNYHNLNRVSLRYLSPEHNLTPFLDDHTVAIFKLKKKKP